MKFRVVVVGLTVLAGCSASRVPSEPQPLTDVRLAQCQGPASSLPDSLARQLAPRTGNMVPDDQWADVALTVPGGFAGFFIDPTAHATILMLTDPTQASVVKQALAGKAGFPLQQATVRQARWNFAQLVDWFNYIAPRTSGWASADKDEVMNRIRFSAMSLASRDSLIAQLEKMPLPCDLVVVDTHLGIFSAEAQPEKPR